MEYYCIFLLTISCIVYVHTQTFTEESPYMLIRLMDIKLNEWKPEMLDRMEKVLDAELKYTDEKKGIRCTSIDFEQGVGYPVQEARFLDLNIRGLCKDEVGGIHNIDKLLMTDAIKRNVDKIKDVTGGTVFSVGNVQLYARNTNKLNWIIIPLSVGITVLLFVITFFLRQLRRKQKRQHILNELQKKKDASGKITQKVPNTDEFAHENQRLLQLDPNVVGNASDTLGSPKEFTNDQYPSPTRPKQSGKDYNSEYRGGTTTTVKENRPVYYNVDHGQSSQNQRTNIPFDNETRLLPSQSQPQYDSRFPDMIPLQEQQPRVVVRTIRDDGNQTSYYPQSEDPSTKYVPIPVQVERSGPHQRYVPPPYHSDPYYRHTNA